ncbi:MAG: adenylate/guanylate cyclase domain-containing protein [Pseudomonadota bacterium]
MPAEVRRKLTTIMAADAAGYSRLMSSDEVRGVSALRSARAVFARLIDRHAGRIANTAGDGLIADFPSVVEAVQCAIEVQNELSQMDGMALQYRIGIHLGDVIVDGEDLLGEGVNLAARLETMAPPGGILISRPVYDQVHAKLSVGFDYLGEKRPRNFAEDVSVYQVTTAHNLAQVQPRVRVEPEPANTAPRVPASGPLPVRRYAKSAALIIGTLVAIDLLTGDGLWSHFPSAVILAGLGVMAVPQGGWAGLGLWPSRALVLVAMLLFINIATWGGTLWVIWPAGAFAVLALWRRINRAPG